ncbi:spermidine/putrescine ABC transporter permease [Microbacterium dextranolyticum]|uniref:Uncharacterized protein n=1 Tax=Microbacterium dextranolyticum TaxID=36806 RepID=A0A9W6M6J0_9MICO|nr:spermidine/putrescine ABC transporter permease [Microbacterium dextranolyticum]MBM7463239.1 hypothetical protein [Microbacterium dextranolyticum]GLJ95655.1 hypothetical protein GCM10017591_17180 [Microbacterium dextranolyticum]
MDATSRDELAALRRRAYGPFADIAADPVATARLRELEERARTDRAPGPSTATADVVGEAPDAAALLRASIGLPTVPLDADEPDAPTVPDSRDAVAAGRRPVAAPWIVAWAASMLVVAVLVGGLVWGLASIPPVAGSAGGRQIATLTEKAEVPEQVLTWVPGGEAEGFAFEGLIVIPTAAGLGMSSAGAPCLLIVPSQGYGSDGSVTGEVFWGCQAGSFPATAQFMVGPQSPSALRERFPDGTALKFVLDGERIGVFVDDAVPTPTSPAAA